jgi:hypothetical protein
MALEWVAWYARALNEMKRECLVAERVQFDGQGKTGS